MSSIKTRLSRLEDRMILKPKTYMVINWNTGKSANDKAQKEIAEIKKNDPNAKIEIIKVEWV